jgi:UDP-glucose-4-epimerase GalE
MAILVTGGAGYIGSHTVKALARAGFEPVVYDFMPAQRRPDAKWGPDIHGDLADTDHLRNVFKDHHIDSVIHFAAFIEVGESVANPRKYFWNNVVNSLRLLDCMVESDVRRMIFSSSAAVYGDPQKIPIPEDHPKQPINPYGEAKLMVERALHWYGQAYGVKWVALRYFNAAGSDGELGEEHDPETHLIPLVIQAALGLRPEVQVFGTDYPTPDGTAVRDYIHVVDLAQAHVQAAQYLEAGGESIALNLGTGKGHSVREVIGSVDKCCGRRAPHRDAPRREADPPALVADPSGAHHVLKWRPQHSELAEIVQSAWDWHSGRRRLK